VEIESVADDGMYDALAKAWDAAPEADAYHYLNAGDLVAPEAASIVARAMSREGVDWLTGMQVVVNEYDAVVRAALPFDYDSRLFYAGVYGRVLPHIQQESTFWSNRLQRTLDFDSLRAFRLAGDQFLWSSFFRFAPLFTVRAFLGAFRLHEGQLSERFASEYLAEAKGLGQLLPFSCYPKLAYHLLIHLFSDSIRARASNRIIEDGAE
jgi:hypothetical protein